MLRLKGRIKILKENTNSLDAKTIAEKAIAKYENANIAGTYLSQFENFLSTELVEELKDIKDPEVEKFILRENRLLAIHNLGVKESIKKIKESEIYSYPTVKYMIEKLKPIEVSPEFLVVEYFINKLEPYLWDKTITECRNNMLEKVEELKEDIALNKAIVEFNNSSSDYLLKSFESELDNYFINRNEPTRIKLLETLENYKFDNQIRKLSNIIKEHTGTFQLASSAGQNEIENVYSPLMVIDEYDVFYTSGRYLKKDGAKVEIVTEEELNKLPVVFKELCEFLSLPISSVTENKITVYSRDKKVEIKNEKSKEDKDILNLYVNEKKVDLKNFNKIFMNAGIFHRDEMEIMNNVYKIVENFNSIANIDYMKRINSNVLDGHWVDIISIEENLYTIKFDARNKINEFAEHNSIQAREMILDFMNYDIAESFRDLISQDEAYIKSLEDNRNEILESIKYLETKKAEVEAAINETKELKEDVDVKEVMSGLTAEIEGLKKSYSELSSKIETLTSSEEKKVEKTEECDDKDKKKKDEEEEMAEEKKSKEKVTESDLPTGAKVKCKESGKTGTIQSWEDDRKVYVVLMDGGNDTEEYEEGQLEVIDTVAEDKTNEDDTKSGTKIKLKDGQFGTVQSWKESTGVYIVLLDGGNDTIEVNDGDFEIVKEVGEEAKLPTGLNDNQKMSIDIMMGKELSDDDIIKIVNSANTDVDHSVEILAYMKKAKGPKKMADNSDAVKEDETKSKDPDKVDLEKKEGEAKKDEIENEEKESPIGPGDKVKLKNGVLGTVQSINQSSGEAIVNMDDGKTIAIPEDKFEEVEVITKKSKEKDPEIKNKEKANKDGESQEVQEGKEEFVDGEIIAGANKGKKVKLKALDFTSKGDKEEIDVELNGKKIKIVKKDLKVS